MLLVPSEANMSSALSSIFFEMVIYLKNAIKAHLKLIKGVSPDAGIIPKQHYLVTSRAKCLNLGFKSGVDACGSKENIISSLWFEKISTKPTILKY